MGFRSGVVVGMGVGYVLGAKAGRERYEQIVETTRSILGDERFQSLAERGKALIQLTTDRARGAMSEGLSATSRRLRNVAGNGERPAAGAGP